MSLPKVDAKWLELERQNQSEHSWNPLKRSYIKILTSGSGIIGCTVKRRHERLSIDTLRIANDHRFKSSLFAAIIEDHLAEINYKYRIHKVNGGLISFREMLIPFESYVDIHYKRVDDLLNDDSPWEHNKIGAFGAIGKLKSKPQRVRFKEMCQDNDNFEYLESLNYTHPPTKDFISYVDLKKKFKYIIDLEGHGYSCKMYPFLAMKRVIFTSFPHRGHFDWENVLKPYENFIPVNKDLSNLQQQFDKVNKDLKLQYRICSNNWQLISGPLSPGHIRNKLTDAILSKCEYSPRT